MKFRSLKKFCLLIFIVAFAICCLSGCAIITIAAYQSDYEIKQKHAQEGYVNIISFSPDGKYILASNSRKELVKWNASTGKVLQRANEYTDEIVFAPNGNYYLTTNFREVVLWDAVTDKQIRTFKKMGEDYSFIWFATFSPDGKYILSGTSDLTVWETQTGNHVKSFITDPKPEEIHYAKFTDDGKFIFTEGYELRKWNWKNTEEVKEYRWRGTGSGFRGFSPDGKYFFIGTNDVKSLILHDTLTKKEIKTFPVCSDYIYNSIVFSPDGQNFLCLCKSYELKLWNIDSGKELQLFNAGSDEISAFAFSPDGKYVITGGKDNALILWDKETGKEIRRFEK
jgi:eukaryotic-like serine/threonine-protein kinase